MTPEIKRIIEDEADRYSFYKVHIKTSERWKIVDAFLEGSSLGFRLGIEEAAKVAEKEGSSNVENPAIDMYERSRRAGIRWCGEWTIKNIRALLLEEDK